MHESAVREQEVERRYSLAGMIERGHGTEKDPVREGELHCIALSRTDTAAANRNSGDWHRATARALQRLLAEKGHYNCAIDGILGAGSKRAMQAVINGP